MAKSVLQSIVGGLVGATAVLVYLAAAVGAMASGNDAPTSPDSLHEQSIQDDRAHAARLIDYLSRTYPDQISNISISGPTIHIQGHLSVPSGELKLAEIPLWEDATALKSPITLQAIPKTDAAGAFTVAIDRITRDGRDRLLSGWAVAQEGGAGYELRSPLHYVDEQTPRAPLPAAKPRSKKGLGGCPFTSPDMEALRISSVTLNIVLNDIMASAPGRGYSPYIHAGKTWYTRDSVVADFDRELKVAANHGWMVSAIILLRTAGNSPAGSWLREAAHPDADSSAAFAMPNFTSRAGVEAYAAAMNFIAERYSRPDGKFGRIHDWIMHNEISSGYYWTSAGDKTLITYLDLYQKSMRLTYLIARQYDANARPLISLDHCWTARSDPRGFAGRDLLDRLIEFTRLEGDYGWGIAYHPYAQDLFNPRTWEDPQALFNFDTPFITFRNIEVLDAWARQPRAEYQSRPREIQLTEQGINSRDYSEKALAEQAAGVAYAWEKIAPLSTITAFQYHIWEDNRTEGGLRLGLRKFGDDRTDPGGKKPSWSIYRLAGTQDWERVTRSEKAIVGVKRWADVHYRQDIK